MSDRAKKIVKVTALILMIAAYIVIGVYFGCKIYG